MFRQMSWPATVWGGGVPFCCPLNTGRICFNWGPAIDEEETKRSSWTAGVVQDVSCRRVAPRWVVEGRRHKIGLVFRSFRSPGWRWHGHFWDGQGLRTTRRVRAVRLVVDG